MEMPGFASVRKAAEPFLKASALCLCLRNRKDGVSRVRFSAATTAERLLPQRTAARIQPLLERIDALLSGHGADSEAGRMSLIAFTIRIVSAAIAFLSQVLLARWMGSFEYGI